MSRNTSKPIGKSADKANRVDENRLLGQKKLHLLDALIAGEKSGFAQNFDPAEFKQRLKNKTER